MLRSRLRADKRDLRRIFDNLSQLRAERQVTLTELPLPISHPPTAPAPQFPFVDEKIRKWESVEQIQQAAIFDDNEPDFRVFEQTLEPPTLLTTPLKELSRQNEKVRIDRRGGKRAERSSKILDAATGLEKTVTSTEGLSEGDLFLLRRFTSALTFISHSPLRASKEVFHWLGRANPRILKLLTPYAWKLMWALEVSQIPSSRSKLIGDKMVSAGVPLSEEQEIAYIGGLFWNEGHDEAFRRWQDYISRPGGGSLPMWNLGVRMYSLHQQPEKAERTIARMVKALGYVDAKTWIPVIMSYNHTYQPEKAWESYEKMRRWAKKNGELIKASQYDDLCQSFLDNGQPALGLDIYKHMVYSGHKALERMKTETYQKLSPAVREAQDLTMNPDELNDLSLDALKNLPPKVADKYFYGGWMKNLMRMGRTDLANFLVREVMTQHGYKSDAIHLNWIIQGFLEEQNLPMAESLAKEMIDERLKQLHSKQSKSSEQPPEDGEEFLPWSVGVPPPTSEASSILGLSTLSESPKPSSEPPKSPVAPATIQTFSLLYHYHARRQQLHKTIELSNLMSDCQIMPNSYILNHLLHALLRSHDMAGITTTYQSLLVTGKITPDLETFHILWMACWRRYTRNIRKYSGFPSPRELFRQTLQHLWIPPKLDTAHPEYPEQLLAQQNSLQELFHKILKSFCLSRDLSGVLVSMHTLSHLWSIRVTKHAIKQVILCLLRLYNWHPVLSRLTGKEVKGSLMQVSQLSKALKWARKRRMGGGGGRKRLVVEATTRVIMGKKKKRAKGTGLEALTVLVRTEMGPGARTVEKIGRAKEEMGVWEKLPGLGM
ncbi:hypothetical protein RUND412_008441 [Rhizina undulata]